MKKHSMTETEILQAGKKVFAIEIKAVSETAKRLDKNFTKAVLLISKCKGRVIVFGIGKSGLIGRKIASTLASTGTPSVFVHPVECLHGDMGILSKDDIVLALSNSGETEELAKLLPILKSRKLQIISITGNLRSKLAAMSNIALNLHIEREACPHNIAPTASTTAMLALGDALAISLMKLKAFGKNDFANLHPGGSLGKVLSLRVRDLMHTGKENPVIKDSSLVKDALGIMTKTRMGATSIINSKGILTGFFTDGDLRRQLRSDTQMLNKKISEVMTRNPVSVTPDTMAIDAARIIHEKKVDNIPVVDSKGRPAGIIDERDLLDILPLAIRDDA